MATPVSWRPYTMMAFWTLCAMDVYSRYLHGHTFHCWVAQVCRPSVTHPQPCRSGLSSLGSSSALLYQVQKVCIFEASGSETGCTCCRDWHQKLVVGYMDPLRKTLVRQQVSISDGGPYIQRALQDSVSPLSTTCTNQSDINFHVKS